jgi:hypothetical protein
MPYRIEFAEASDRDLDLIFDHLFESYAGFGESTDQALDRAGQLVARDHLACVLCKNAQHLGCFRPKAGLAAVGRGQGGRACLAADLNANLDAGDAIPFHRRGVTTLPGLYFLGLPRLHKVKSAFLWGVGEDAAHIADEIHRRV